MWNPFRKRPEPITPLQQAQELCDIANELIPQLPRGFSFWMDWSTRPPQLTINERTPGKRVYPDR